MEISVPNKEKPRIYWPRELKEGGYTGKLKILEGFSAVVIPRPRASNKDLAKTLELMAQDFRYRAQTEESESQKLTRME